MKKLTHNIGAKAAAIVLFAFLVVFTVGSFAGFVYAWEENMYDREDLTVEDSNLCRNMAYSMLYRVLDIYENHADQIPEMFAEEYTNLSFIITPSSPEEPRVQNYRIAGEDYNQEIDLNGYTIQYAVNGSMQAHDSFYWGNMLFELVYPLRGMLLFFMILGTLASISLLIFLCCSAGHRKGEDAVTLNYQDRVPFDLYLAATCLLVFLDVEVFVENSYMFFTIFEILFGAAALLIVALLFAALVMTTATRIKTKTLWKNTVVYRLAVWGVKALRKSWEVTTRFFHKLPMIWRTVLATLVLLAANIFLSLFAVAGTGLAALLLVFLYAAVLMLVCGVALQLRKLQKAGEELAAGHSGYKVDTEKMYWDFKRHGENLNSIGDGIAAAVEERTRSERLKTELITNVSHDIKTPLTSIINYVDLLQKEHAPEEEKTYIEVLNRQSHRLKKLTDDLVEASKASSGNIAVSLKKTNVFEMVNQAVGEYEERFRAAALEPVVHVQPLSVAVMADGRLLWRVLDNLLNNVCKYSQPGTRVYIDAIGSEKEVVFSVKNISREKLNINSEELTERFVRGDVSRNTEGSGLGLNIAKSLTELQNGQFILSIDGDLFKAELRFQNA